MGHRLGRPERGHSAHPKFAVLASINAVVASSDYPETNPDIKKAFLESLTCDWWAVNDERLRPTTVVTARSSVRVSSLGASFPFYGTNDRHRVVPSGGCVSDSIRRIVSFFPLVVEVGLNFSNVSQRITKADAKH